MGIKLARICERMEELALNENHNLSLISGKGTGILRVLTLIGLFFGAYALVQAVFALIQYYQAQDVSMLVVVVYLLVIPFMSAAAVLFTFFVHRAARGEGSDGLMILGFAMTVMAAVDNLIYISIHHSGDSVSFYILGGIELVCFIICFLYYQGIGGWGVTLCASILITACMALELEEAVRYFASIGEYDFTGFYFAKTLLNLIVAVESLLFTFFVKSGIEQRA